MTTMCQLIAEVGEDARFPELARGWFAGVLADLLPDVAAGLAAGRALYKRDPRDASVDTLWGEPHAVHAILQVTKKPNGPIARWVQYSPAAWRRFLDGMSGYPYGAVMGITPLDANGRPFADEGTATIEVTRLRNDPRWATFSFTVGAALAGPAQVAGQWTAFARQQAKAMAPGWSGWASTPSTCRSRPRRRLRPPRFRWRPSTTPSAPTTSEGPSSRTSTPPPSSDAATGVSGGTEAAGRRALVPDAGNWSRASSSWVGRSGGQPNARAAGPLRSVPAAALVKWTYSPQFVRWCRSRPAPWASAASSLKNRSMTAACPHSPARH